MNPRRLGRNLQKWLSVIASIVTILMACSAVSDIPMNATHYVWNLGSQGKWVLEAGKKHEGTYLA